MLRMFWGYVKINQERIIYVLICSLLFMFFFEGLQKNRKNPPKRTVNNKLSVWLLGLASSFILIITLFGREQGEFDFVLIPFYSYYKMFANGNIEHSLQIVMNIMMYIPFSFFLLCCFKKLKKRHSLFISLICAMTIEIIQWYFQIGFFETDDIINNVLGAMIGALLYKIVFKIREKIIGKGLKETGDE